MLKKLLKYDLTSVFKFIVIFYALSLFFGISARICSQFENSLAMDIIGAIFNGASISMMFSTIINNLMRLWVRFKTNFYSDESYLTHTLPIDRRTQYMSKFLTSVISMFVSVLVIALTLFILYYSKENMEFIKAYLFPIADSINVSTFVLVTGFLFLIFLEFLNVLQCGFTGIILGHKMSSAKTGLSVVFGFIANSVTQFALLIILFGYGIFNENVKNMFFTNSAIDFPTFKIITAIAIVMYLIVIAIVCAVNIKLFKRGVNIE